MTIGDSRRKKSTNISAVGCPLRRKEVFTASNLFAKSISYIARESAGWAVRITTTAVVVLLSTLAAVACATAPSSQMPKGTAVIPLNYLPALSGDYFELMSKETGRQYHIYVRLPESYSKAFPETRYPVVYLLDGDSLFPILATEHLFLVIDEKLPEAITVGIAYGSFDPSINKRDVDFTAPADGVKRNVRVPLHSIASSKRNSFRRSNAGTTPIRIDESCLDNPVEVPLYCTPHSPILICFGDESRLTRHSKRTATDISKMHQPRLAAIWVSWSPAVLEIGHR